MSLIIPRHGHHLVDPSIVPHAAKEFVHYCENEYEQRASSGKSFDESLFQSAIDLILRKIRNLEKRECA